MSKIQPVVTRQKNTIRKERTYDVLSSPYKEKAEMVQKYSEKATYPNKQKEKRKKHVCVAIGAIYYTLIQGRSLFGKRLLPVFFQNNDALVV